MRRTVEAREGSGLSVWNRSGHSLCSSELLPLPHNLLFGLSGTGEWLASGCWIDICSFGRSLTNSSEDKCYEIPRAGLNQLVSMIDCRQSKQNDENSCRGETGRVSV